MATVEASHYAKVYWGFAGAAIAVATAVNVIEKAICWQRLRDVESRDRAKPKSFPLRAYATLTALSRESGNYAPSIWTYTPPPLGRILLVLSNFALLLILEYYGFEPENFSSLERISVRAAHLTLTQLPLVFLLAGKTNVIGFLTGSSYERLNWLHRWTARTLFITATIHFLSFIRVWDRSNYVARKFEVDELTRTGLGTWCILLWIVLSSFAPIRNWRYELFVVQHVISMIGFLVLVMLHIPVKYRVYVWIPIAITAADRLVRLGFTAWNNLGLFQRGREGKSAFACQAVFTPMPSNAVKVTVQNPTFKWKPGQHVLFSCHSLVPLQSHPFTITSLPSDGNLSFLIQAKTGATLKLHGHCTGMLPPIAIRSVVLDGPYGRMRPLEQFDIVTLIAGSSGASFTIPLFRDLLRKAREEGKEGLVTRRIRFVWAVKSRGQIEWFKEELQEAFSRSAPSVEVEASIFVTCDEKFTLEITEAKRAQIGEVGKVSEVDEKKGAMQDTIQRISVESVEDTKPCCCRGPADSSESIDQDDIQPCCGTCCCASPGPSGPSQNTSQARSLLPEQCGCLVGRPTTRNIIKRELELARGESAVVVCGPKGLVDEVRRDVVSLCDERAVHKGTGAQGVYLHSECFGW